MIEEQHIKPMLKFLKDLEKVFEKHSGGMTYTNRDDGIHATMIPVINSTPIRRCTRCLRPL